MYSLGIDLSTQSLTAVALDINTREQMFKCSVNYLGDIPATGMREDYLLPPSELGDARQPVAAYLLSLDRLFEILSGALGGRIARNTSVINISVQQHGHVFLSNGCESAFRFLLSEREKTLSEILPPAFSLDYARIWRTANTTAESEAVRSSVGGGRRMMELSGSDAPLRYSGFGIMKSAKLNPESYKNTVRIQLLNGMLASILTGERASGVDFGNASGTSLMDFNARKWSTGLLNAVAQDMPEGAMGLKKRLPPIIHPLDKVGNLAAYFADKYGFSRDCAVLIGTGDNGASKVLLGQESLSLGTSIVFMVETKSTLSELPLSVNAMYDGLGKPFVYGCRTNGVLVWDKVLDMHERHADYEAAEKALLEGGFGSGDSMMIWQPEEESFPKSKVTAPVRVGYEAPDFTLDYNGVVESSLGLVYLGSRGFRAGADSVWVTGGAASNRGVLRKIAAIWNCRVKVVESAGAAFGAALAGIIGLSRLKNLEKQDRESGIEVLQNPKYVIDPLSEDVYAYHRDGGYLDKLSEFAGNILNLDIQKEKP